MAYVPLGGTAQRYLDTQTGETISRRQYETRERPVQLRERETRYKERVAERRAEVSALTGGTKVVPGNRRYWRQRFSEQYADKHGISDREALEIAKLPGSRFNRLFAEAEAQGFRGGKGSAWDTLAKESGAKGGGDDERERSKYLAVISWHMRNDDIGQERWLERNADGEFIRYSELA